MENRTNKNSLLPEKLIADIFYEVKDRFNNTMLKLNEAELDEKLFQLIANNCYNEYGGSLFYLPSPMRIGLIGNDAAYCVAFHKSSDDEICLSVVYDAHAGYFAKFGYVTDSNIRNNDYETRELGEDNKFSLPFKLNLEIYPNYKALIYAQAKMPKVQEEAKTYSKLRKRVTNINRSCDTEKRGYTLEEHRIIRFEKYLHARYNCNDLQAAYLADWNEFRDMTPKEYISWKAQQKKEADLMKEYLDEILTETKK